MNKLLRLFLVYSFFALTGVIITSGLLFRSLTGSLSQTSQDIAKIRDEMNTLQAKLEITSKEAKQIDQAREVLATSEASPSAKTGLGYVTILDTSLKAIDIYEDKTFSSKAVGKLEAEKAYRYSKKENGWYLVRISDDKEGWANTRFVKEIPEQP